MRVQRVVEVEHPGFDMTEAARYTLTHGSLK
jgi:hypothetical protein